MHTLKPAESLEELNNFIDSAIHRCGHAVIGVYDTGMYTVGLTPDHGFEIFVPLVDEKFRTIINELVFNDRLEVGKVYESSTLQVRGSNLRLRLVEVTDQEDRLFVINHLLCKADERYHLGDKKVLLLEIGDRNNVLPGEPGYDYFQGVAKLRMRIGN